VLSVGDGIARVYGLDNVQSGEMVEFENGTRGMALNLETDNVGIVIFGADREIKEGQTVKRTGAIVDTPVGKGLLGRVVDALGNPIDGKGPDPGRQADARRRQGARHYSAQIGQRADGDRPQGDRCPDPDRPWPARIDHRRPPDRQDRGRARHHSEPEAAQRSDRREDQAVLHLCCDRQKRSTVAQFVKVLEEQGALEYSIIVAATASDPAPMQYIAPFTGCTMGEYFRDNGMHAVIIYDDLSKQAVGLSPDVAAAAPPAGPRSLSRRRVLSAFAPARARRQIERRARLGLADGAAGD